MDDLLIRSKTVNLDVGLVKEQLERGNCIDYQDPEGVTLLQLAASNENYPLVSFLLNKGAKVDLANNSGWTALLHAAFHGHLHVVELLIQFGANVNACNKLGLSVLSAAACNGHILIAKILLSNGLSAKIRQNIFEVSPLLVSSFYGQVEMTRLLLEMGEDSSQATHSTKITPLMLAACTGQILIAQILLESGADANAVNVAHRNALEIASLCGQPDIKNFLHHKTNFPITQFSNEDQEKTRTINFIKTKNLESLKHVLGRNPDLVNSELTLDEKTKVTPLMQAAMVGCPKVVAYLLSQGAWIDAQDPLTGQTPLMLAVHHNKVEVIELLLEAGANIDLQANGGVTAVDMTWLRDGSKHVADLLLSKRTKKKAYSPFLQAELASTQSESSQNKSGTLRSLRHSFGRENIKNLVDNLTLKIQHIRDRSSSTGSNHSFYSSGPSFAGNYDEVEDGNVFLASRDSAGSKRSAESSTSNQFLKLSNTKWPTKTNYLTDPEWLKPIKNPCSPDISSLTTVKELISSAPKRLVSSFYSYHHLIYKLNQHKRKTVHDEMEKIEKSKMLDTDLLTKEESNVYGLPIDEKVTNCIYKSSDDLEMLLKKLSLENYLGIFLENEVDLQVFKTVTEDDLHEMGVNHKDCSILLAASKSFS